MKNIEIKQEKGKLVVTIDTTKEFGLSKSGKTITIASTQGNVELDGGVYLGVNAYKYANKK